MRADSAVEDRERVSQESSSSPGRVAVNVGRIVVTENGIGGTRARSVPHQLQCAGSVDRHSQSPADTNDSYGVFGVLYSTSLWNGFQTVS